MKKLVLALVLLTSLFLSSSYVFAQTTFIVIQQPPVPADYSPVAYSIRNPRLEKWIAENERRRAIKRIERKKTLQAQRKRLKELKAKLYSHK